jgi:hypothetical protein
MRTTKGSRVTSDKERGVSRRWRTIAIVTIGVALGTTLTAPPVYSHVGGTVAHLWTKHIRPQADKRYPTKAAAEGRYVNVGEKASDAELFDGLDSNIFVTANTAAGGDLTGTYPSPAVGPDAIGSAEVQPNSLTGADIHDGAIGGDQVDELSLAQVPSAASADTVNGRSAARFNSHVTDDATQNTLRTLFTFGGLTLSARCQAISGSDLLVVHASTAANNSYIRSDIAGIPPDADWQTFEQPGGGTYWFASDLDKAGVIVYRRSGSSDLQAEVTSVTLAWDTDGLGCYVSGTVLGLIDQ